MQISQDSSAYLDLDQQCLLMCVDPRAVTQHVEDTVHKLQGDQAACTTQNWPMPTGGEFYGSTATLPLPAVKLEMEEFGDLSSYLPATAPKPMSSNSVDELNTPVFEKDSFDFPTIIPDKASYGTMFPFKIEYSAFETQKPPIAYKDLVFGHAPEHPTGQTVDSSPLSPDKYSYHSASPEQTADFQGYQTGIVTPEDSNSSIEVDTKPRLILDMPGNMSADSSVVSTPDVIEEVVNMESHSFNILDLVNEDVTVLEAEILRTLTDTSTTATVISTTSTFGSIAQKRPRKRRVSDSDEDYIPPGKKLSSKHLDSDDSDYEEDLKKRKLQPRPRGRPPRRTGSISSDASKEGDVSKYRELRDKNNEASRRSRLKRKMKEMEYEKEADELSLRNVKLKAQVEELEKMVNNFRTNLFKIMIKK